MKNDQDKCKISWEHETNEYLIPILSQQSDNVDCCHVPLCQRCQDAF